MVTILFLGLGLFSGCITEEYKDGTIEYCSNDVIMVIYNEKNN